MAEERLAAIHPLRRVDRSKYSDPEMPEFPGAVFLNHLGVKTATIGALAGCLIVAPLSWMRGGRKDALVKTVMPRVAGPLMAGGYFVGVGLGAAMATADKKKKQGWSAEEVDDRAYRLVNNKICQDMNNFAGAGAVAAYFAAPSGLLGPVAVGMAGGSLAYLFANAAMPKIRKEVWPQITPQITEGLTAAGIDVNTLTTGGTPPGKKK